MSKKYLGINGLGRIGKLLLWNQLIENHFDGYVVSLGRNVGSSLEDLIDFVLNDSTYGSLERLMYGYAKNDFKVEIINEENNEIMIDGKFVKFLTKDRNPKDIKWAENNVEIVCDCTGVFLNPEETEAAKGTLRGHLEAGAKKVVASAPFKLKGSTLPEDSAMLVYGINHETYDTEKHNVVSAASCTTTALAHMMKPLIDNIGINRIATVSMSTIHAATNNQNLLDALPANGATDLRKSRSALNSIILTSTGAAKALKHVMPEVESIGFMADSIRIPTNTVSLVSLNLTIKPDTDNEASYKIDADAINKLYKDASLASQEGFLHYSERQNVSNDLRGYKGSAVIESVETTTKTEKILSVGGNDIELTHAKIFGWYDNEFGSYVNSLSNIIIHMDKELACQVDVNCSKIG